MTRLSIYLVPVVAMLAGAAGPASAGEGPRPVDGPLVGPAPCHGCGWHRANRPRRTWGVPLALNRRSPAVTVVVRQTIVPPMAPLPALGIPSILDLPVSAGIRETPAAQATVLVLNDSASAKDSMPGEKRPTAFKAGPRIVSLDPDRESEGDSGGHPRIGARIIHLSVPVAR